MNDKLYRYVNNLFEDAPKNKKTYDLKEELLSNLDAKYTDLMSDGYPEDEACNIVISSIGDVDELINRLNSPDEVNSDLIDERKKKSALLVAVAVGLYILSPCFVIIFDILSLDENLGVIPMFICIAIATGILIYNGMTSPKYLKKDETLVEEFKEWKAANSENVRIKKSITSAMWITIVAIYLVISFYFYAWSFSWIIFVIGAAIDQIISAVFDLKKRR
ncbi:permease prefix domain 1-containing protein [Clostridium sp. UBA1652]|uniref:permease prefix domain 1-containing protein n=1 Tax=Clostridium sp. UBA1652 TaxID=1946348 RepID=UPI00257F1DA6|nr:permease prefix domain 1-containing protein [Clostridium sp. UBA1652]